MNLWIILAITWISVSVVIADSRWFVQDTPPGGENEDIFSNEQLLRVNNKPKLKTVPQVKTVEAKHLPAKQQTDTLKEKKVTGAKPALTDLEAEELLVVNPTGRKPLQNLNKGENNDAQAAKTDKSLNRPPTEWFIRDASDEIEGSDGLFPSEHLIRVKTKSTTPRRISRGSQSAVDTKPSSERKKISNQTQPKYKAAYEEEPVHAMSRKPLQVAQSIKNPLQDDDKGQLKTQDHIKTPPQQVFMQASANVDTWFSFGNSVTTNYGQESLSEEHLIRVPTKPKQQTKQQTVLQKVSPKEKRHQVKQDAQRVAEKSIQPALLESTLDVSRMDELLPVTDTGRKPLQFLPERTDEEPVEETETPCDPEKNINCLMEGEDLILVNKKKSVHPPSDVKRLIKQDTGETFHKGNKAETEKPKVPEVRRESLHRRLMETEDTPRLKASDGESVGATEEDIILPHVRVRRADDDDNSESNNNSESNDNSESSDSSESNESGDGGFDGEQAISNTSHVLVMRTTTNLRRTSLTDEDKQNISTEFKDIWTSILSAQNGFQDIRVNNVSLDGNGRVVIDWDLVLDTSAAEGSTQAERLQNTLDYLVDVVAPFMEKNLTVFGEPVYQPINGTVLEVIARNILENPCKVTNPCPNGYTCIQEDAICRHLCYHDDFYLQCRHGSSCQLNNNFQPYCQCGSAYTGTYCQETVPQSDYTTGQVVGAGVAGAACAVGATGCVIYLAACRKKKEEDMEYSYFGDDDDNMPAYSDPGSNLGLPSDFYIQRPSLNVVGNDLYNQDGAMA